VSENADVRAVTKVLAHSMLAMSLAVVAVGAPAAVCPIAGAQPQGRGDGQPPAPRDGWNVTPRRLVARFDFEESAQFNPGVPVGFDPPPDPTAIGYSPFGTVTIAEGIGRADDGKGYAVRFELDGGSMVRFRSVPLEGVSSGSDLLLRTWIRTEGLRHAAVRVSLRFMKGDDQAVAGIYASDLIRAETEWRQLEVQPPPVPAEAKSLQIWLEVVQPGLQNGVDGDRFEVAKNDVKGRAYFDDIEVWQMPSVRFEPEALGIVAPAGEARLRVRCDDPMVKASTVDVRVRGASGETVFEKQLTVPADREVVLGVPGLPTGWYEAEARFSHGRSEIARRLARFAVLPDDPFEPDQPPRFGVSLGAVDMPIEPVMDLARSAFVVLPVWSAATETRDPTAEIERLRPLVGRLLDRRVEPMFRIGAVPARLANAVRIESDDALGLFALEESRWRPALEPWLLAFGQRVDQWLIGSQPVDADRPDLATRLSGIARTMGSAVAGPLVTVPWAPEEPVPADLAAAVERERHVLEFVADPAWREGGAEVYEGFAAGARGMVRIVPLPAGLVDDGERAIDLALRAIDAWRAGFDAVSVEVREESLPPVPGPALELAAWRQISTRLCGRRFVADIPIAEGVRAVLADGARGPALVLWSDAGEREVAVDVDLGTQPVRATDLWGRSRVLPPTTRGHALRVGREPLFVEGVSREMCLLRTGFRVDPVFAESRRAPQEGVLVLANPWTRTLAGTLTVLGPAALEISPKTHRFDIAPGGEVRIPVSFSVPRSTEAGAIPIEVEVSGTADEPFRARLSSPLEVGYRKAVVDPSWRLARSIESGAIDLVLTLRVTNVSDAPIDVEAFAGADGYVSDRKLVSTLAPGATAVRAFHFKDGARRLSGREIRAGVHDPESDARLLKRVPVPALLPPAAGVAGVDPNR